MGRTRTVIWLIGVLAAVAAAVLLVVPDPALRLPPLRRFVSSLAAIDPKQFVLLLSGLLGLVALVLSLFRGSEHGTADRFDDLREQPPEAVTEGEAPRSGAALDRQITAAVDGHGNGLGTVRRRLRSSAVRTYARTSGVEESAARKAVATGTWTDDPTAAAFLAAPNGPVPSLASRLRLWLDPAAERRRRIEATVAAVESLLDDGSRWSR